MAIPSININHSMFTPHPTTGCFTFSHPEANFTRFDGAEIHMPAFQHQTSHMIHKLGEPVYAGAPDKGIISEPGPIGAIISLGSGEGLLKTVAGEAAGWLIGKIGEAFHGEPAREEAEPEEGAEGAEASEGE